MLDFTHGGIYTDPAGTAWTYYLDDSDANAFLVVPRPRIALDPVSSQPCALLIRDATDDAATGSGRCQFTVELDVPQAVVAAITALIPSAYPQCVAPSYQRLELNPNATAFLTFGSRSVQAPVARYGTNVATFAFSLSATEMPAYMAAFGANGPGCLVEYQVAVPAVLRGCSAVLEFDATTAFAYQLRQPGSETWPNGASTRMVTEQLMHSPAAQAAIAWGGADHAAYDATVADWANATLAVLIRGVLNGALALRTPVSAQPFWLSSAGSFRQVYDENQVVGWTIATHAMLSDAGESVVKVAQAATQTMTVVAHLPFTSDLLMSGQEGAIEFAAVRSLTVTVRYPTLAPADATYSFTSSGSHTFVCDRSVVAESAWFVDYTVHYAAGAQLTATMGELVGESCVLSPLAAGLMTVTFDASAAFSPAIVPDSVMVEILFTSDQAIGQAFRHSVTLTEAAPTATAISAVQYPLDPDYNYAVTYDYNGQIYTAPTMRGATGGSQQIGPMIRTDLMNVIVAWDTATFTSSVLGAIVKLWYSSPPGVQGVEVPTETNPIVYQPTMHPIPGSTWTMAGEMFDSLAGSRSALCYSALIEMPDGSIAIGPQRVDPSISSIEVAPSQRYFTVEIDPSAIDWKTTAYALVNVDVQLSDVGGGTSSQTVPRAFTWYSGDSLKEFVTFAYTLGPPYAAPPQIRYTWSATYVQAGREPVTTAPVTSDSAILAIPASPAVATLAG